MMWRHSLFLLAQASDCVLTARTCQNYPQYVGQFYDHPGFNDVQCFHRAKHLHDWCGNGDDTSVAATFDKTMISQVYRPNACDPGWSLYAAHCYIHIWEKKTWWDSEASCRMLGGSLASIHNDGENNFVFLLTGGMSAWIGFTHIDKQPETTQWTDTSPPDFTNWSKNCTNPDAPGCKPEETAQQWYDWDGKDLGTYVCKKETKVPTDLIEDWTLDDIWEKSWEIPEEELSVAVNFRTENAIPSNFTQELVKNKTLAKGNKTLDAGSMEAWDAPVESVNPLFVVTSKKI